MVVFLRSRDNVSRPQGRFLFAVQPLLEKPMNKLLAVLVAFAFAFGSVGVMAADPPAPAAAAKKLEKPANVTAEAWAKMTDAEKQKAVDTAKAAAPAGAAAAAAPPKKEKKGGC
jgi:hypothetical protein